MSEYQGSRVCMSIWGGGQCERIEKWSRASGTDVGTCWCVCVRVRVCVCVYVCMYVCVYVCVCV